MALFSLGATSRLKRQPTFVIIRGVEWKPVLSVSRVLAFGAFLGGWGWVPVFGSSG